MVVKKKAESWQDFSGWLHIWVYFIFLTFGDFEQGFFVCFVTVISLFAFLLLCGKKQLQVSLNRVTFIITTDAENP